MQLQIGEREALAHLSCSDVVDDYYFEKRPYIVRSPELSELSTLIAIEKSCWPENILTLEQSRA